MQRCDLHEIAIDRRGCPWCQLEDAEEYILHLKQELAMRDNWIPPSKHVDMLENARQQTAREIVEMTYCCGSGEELEQMIKQRYGIN